jgi:O-antigen ligase
MRKTTERLNKAISLVFYALFIFTPLAMYPYTSELFEFNKMWVVFIFSLLIFFLWGVKMVIQKRFEVRRTPFDIPLLLFLLSQIISTIFSLDPHVSFWGYYSRFNGGLLSTIAYIFLYYAFSTNILTSDKEESIRKTSKMILAVIFSGVLVALWGLPSHFGYDPTCLIFRGSLDVSCWTSAFQPKIRMFSTLGQPNWLAAYLSILIPLTIAFAMKFASKIKGRSFFSKNYGLTALFALFSLLFYLDLGWTLSQSGFLGFWAGEIAFVVIFGLLILKRNTNSLKKSLQQKSFQVLIGIHVVFILATFFTTIPLQSLQKYTFSNILKQETTAQQKVETQTQNSVSQPALEQSITGSGQIRLIVWRGAIEIWKAHPIFGSGVETYAYAYYKFRPASHNLTSEWDFLYNKAHNEFLNYLATTGIFGLGTYLFFLFAFLFFALKHFIKQFKKGVIGDPLFPALVASFLGIQISNFFGFSVVVVNLLMFFIPLFFFSLDKSETSYFILPKKAKEETVPNGPLSTGQIMTMIGIGIVVVYSIIFLVNFWEADINYSFGYNYDQISGFAQANPYLEKAVAMRGGEDLYKNELSVNLAALSLLFAQKKDTQNATLYATRAKELSDEVVAKHPNNVVFWKARTRVMFSLAQLNSSVMEDAIQAIQKSHELAPTDAKVLYNEALIYDQVGQKDKALEAINQTIRLKDNYRDAYYAKALFLSQDAQKEKDKEKAQKEKDEAIATLNFSLKNIAPNDKQAEDLLKTLK